MLQFPLFWRMILLTIFLYSHTIVSYKTACRFAKCHINYISLYIFHAKAMAQFKWYHLNTLKITHVGYHQNRSNIRQSAPCGRITRQHGAWAVSSGRLLAECLWHRLHKRLLTHLPLDKMAAFLGRRQFPMHFLKLKWYEFRLKVHWKVFKGPISNIPALIQKMAWRRSGDKPLSEPMLVCLLTNICVTWPLWVDRCTIY